ncbi:rhamnogalacturonan acetylesterase [Hymenobacter sp. RP-2-7]|uniref:Rhamnogalacturonan acetylesterase n=1 Tax=Hymenobacter polaris TaxID=2682546 RepID=A0A7Y0AAF1_9BACT|nr:rhamnogalacturonan acetylesterase [Hymenobacter polaris]NML63698.1 rhamnogalacturonan acetylesterase [Hymenobacter polaris]
MRILRLLPLLAMLLAAAPAVPPPLHLYLIGDSTMADKVAGAFPETGWGMPLRTFFDSTVVVDNRAKNGRSTRTFLAENRWQPIVDALQPGDYVLIQFGHNDEATQYPDRYTPPADYRRNLARFVAEALARHAQPVLLTPITRRKFDAAGRVPETHAAYSAATRAVAAEYHVPLLDLDEQSRRLLEQFGPETSKLLFLDLGPGEHPNYPYGRHDNTHFSELGARKMAELAVRAMQAQHLPLAGHLARPLPKNAVPPPAGPDAQPTK